jgi:hypothetical protein
MFSPVLERLKKAVDILLSGQPIAMTKTEKAKETSLNVNNFLSSVPDVSTFLDPTVWIQTIKTTEKDVNTHAEATQELTVQIDNMLGSVDHYRNFMAMTFQQEAELMIWSSRCERQKISLNLSVQALILEKQKLKCFLKDLYELKRKIKSN